MLPHQERVVKEEQELDEKIEKLNNFLGTSIFASLDTREQERLSRQLYHMQCYSSILAERIVAFG